MRPAVVIAAVAAVLVALLCLAGCTSPQGSGSNPAGTGATPISPASSSGAGTGGIDTTIPVHFDDFACIDVQAALGKEYLFPDETYTLVASPAAKGGVTVTVLLLDFNDNLKLRQTKPLWNTIQKTWIYEDLVPLIQLNDVTTTQQKTVTIKKQGKYYLCVDDRKEMGVADTTFLIPVKFYPAG